MAKQIANLATRYRTGSLTLEQYETQVREVALAETQMSIASKAAAVGLNLLANALPVIVISLIVSGISEYNRKLEETRQKQDEAAKSAKDETQKLEELYDKYKSLSEEVKTNDAVKSDLQSTTTELLKLLGIEEDQVDKLIDKYGTLDDVIDKVAYDTLVQSQADLGTDVENKWQDIADDLGKINQDIVGGLIKDSSGNIINEILNSMGLQGAKERHKNVIGDQIRDEIRLYLPSMFDTSSIEGIEQMYDTYNELLKNIEAKLGSAAYNNPFYQSVKQRVDELKPLLNDYSDALDTYDDNISRQMILLKKMSDGVPETAEAFEIWRNELVETAKANKSYFDDSDIEGSIDKALGSMAEFSQYMSDFSHTTENVEFTVKPTFTIDESSITESLTTLKENIDDILKNADLFDKAIESMTKGESISFDDMMKLVGLDPSLANKFTQTADGYKATLEDLNEARKNYIQDTQDTLSESIKTNNAFVQQIQQNIVDLQAKRAEYAKHINSQDDVKNLEKYDAQIAYQQELLERVQQTNAESSLYQTELNTTYKAGASAVQSYDDVLKDLANKESLLDSVHKEMNSDGQISISTYQKLLEAGQDYADLVSFENGKLKLNEQALKDLTKKKYEDEIATLELLWAEENYNNAMAHGGISVKTDRMKEIEEEIEQKKKMLELWNNYAPTDSGSSGNKDKTKASYSNDLQLLKDQLNDRVITYEQFLQRWQALNDKYHNMSEEDGGISDYEWGQNNRDIIAERTKAYEEKKKSLQEMYEAGQISLDEYSKRVDSALNHWMSGYAQLKTAFSDASKENAKDIASYSQKEYEKETEAYKKQYQAGEITLEQLNTKLEESAKKWLGNNLLLTEEFAEATDKNYEYIKEHFFDKLDKDYENLMDKYEQSGDPKYLDEAEKRLLSDADGLGYVNAKIDALRKNGVSDDSEEMQFWLSKQKDFNGDLKSILDERNQIIDDSLSDQKEATEQAYKDTGDNSVYKTYAKNINDAKQGKLDLIEAYKKLGFKEDSDVIKNLNKEIGDLDNELVEVNKTYANTIIDIANNTAEGLQRDFELTGDTSLYDDMINSYEGAQNEISQMIDEAIDGGMDANSEYVLFLKGLYNDLGDKIIGVIKDITSSITDTVDEQLDELDRKYNDTKDITYLQKKIPVLEYGKNKLRGRISELLDNGYTEDSEEVKTLYKQIEEYDDKIIESNKETADSIVDITEKSVEALQKQYEHTGDTSLFDDIIESYKNAQNAIGQMITDAINSGMDENSDYVQFLGGLYDDLGDKIKGVNNDITSSITDNIDDQIKAIDKTIEQTGDYSKLYDKIDVYKKGKASIAAQIAKYLVDGYSMESEEVKSLVETLDEYDDNILNVYSSIADRIKTETDEQIELIDREISQTGDTSKYQIKLNILIDAKQQLKNLRDSLIEAGTDANSVIIKDLDKRIDNIDIDIKNTSKERVDAQVDAYSEAAELEKDRLNKYKDEQDKIFDAKIKALEAQKKKLEEQNAEIEKQNELQEKQLAIINAQRGVMKSLRMVYSGDGSWTMKPTDESIQQLQEAEKDLDATLRKQQIEAIDNLIEEIKDQQTTFNEGIEKQIEAIDNGVAKFSEAMTDNSKTYARLDYELIASILGEDDANTFKTNFDTYYANNVKTDNAEDTSSVDALTGATQENTEATKEHTSAIQNVYDSFAENMQKEFGLGNVDLTNRPLVSGKKMREAGYDVDENGTSTVYTSTHFIWQGDEESGKYVAVHVTPILPNGEVLTEQELENYIYNNLEGANNILEADDKGIILKVDTDLDLSEEDIASLKSGELTENMQNVVAVTDEWDNKLHEAQETWMILYNTLKGNPIETDNTDKSKNDVDSDKNSKKSKNNDFETGAQNKNKGMPNISPDGGKQNKLHGQFNEGSQNNKDKGSNKIVLSNKEKSAFKTVVDFFGSGEFEGFLGTVQKIANGKLSVGILPTSIDALNRIASGANIVENQTINNISNFTPNINNHFTINAPANSAEEIKNAVVGVIDTKIVQSFRAFYDGYNQQATKEVYGN